MKRQYPKDSRYRSAQSGQAIVIIALAMIVLLLFVGLAIDGNRLFELKRKEQNAADAATLAGSYARCTAQFAAINDPDPAGGWDGNDSSSDVYFTRNGSANLYLLGPKTQAGSWMNLAWVAAQRIWIANGFDPYTNSNTTVTFDDPDPLSGPDPLGSGSANDPNTVRVIIASSTDGTPLSRLMYQGPLAAEARAAARCKVFVPPTILKNAALGNLCLLGSQCPGNGKNSIEITGQGGLQVLDGNLVDNSNWNGSYALDTSGQGQFSVGCSTSPAPCPFGFTPDIVTGNLNNVNCSAVTNISHMPAGTNPCSKTDTPVSSNPWAGNMPIPPNPGNCTTPTAVGNVYTLVGGHCYIGGITLHASDSLTCQAGTAADGSLNYVYWYSGDITGDGTFNCSNVDAGGGGLFIYFDGDQGGDSGSATHIKLTGSGAMKWYAPTIGTYKGLAFFQNQSYNSNYEQDFQGSTLDMHGTFYMPNNDLNLTGTNASTVKAQFIDNSLKVAGQGLLTIQYDPTVLYNPPPKTDQNF
jgi:hypothetical protein